MKDSNNLSLAQAFSSTLVNGTYRKTGFSLCCSENSISFFNDYHRRPPIKRLPHLRSKITSFSDKSQLRIKKLFARVRMSTYSHVLFVTLTWHYGHESIEGSYYDILNVFLQRLRDNFSTIDYIWRLEFQKRGAPHFHIVLLFRSKLSRHQYSVFKKWIMKSWHEIADPKSRKHEEYGCMIAIANDYKQAFFYLSKYCCKESAAAEKSYSGRRWGKSSTLDCRYVFELNLPYAVYMFFRAAAYKVLSDTGRVSSDFLSFVVDDCSLFLYLPISFVEDTIRKLIVDCLRSNDPKVVKTYSIWLNSLDGMNLY
jgi:hypothetical protein